jgi:hypothetical protein
MIRSRSCSWCHTQNHVGPAEHTYCKKCGHRADASRLECDCPRCRPATPPGTTPMPYRPTASNLALALFYNCPLETTGNGTLSQAEEQACLMLAAGELYDAAKEAEAVLIDLAELAGKSEYADFFGPAGEGDQAINRLKSAVKKATLREP